MSKDDLAGSRTKRDLVWDAALRALSESPGSIKYRDVDRQLDESVSRRTIQRTLNAMAALGWLEKEKRQGHYWYPGRLSLQNLSAYSDESAKRDVAEQARERTTPSDVEKRRQRAREVADETDEQSLDERIEQEIEDAPITGSGRVAELRREAMRDIMHYIAEQGTASPSEIREEFYDDHSAGYQTPDSWWTNLVYKCLRKSDLYETGGEGSHTWAFKGL